MIGRRSITRTGIEARTGTKLGAGGRHGNGDNNNGVGEREGRGFGYLPHHDKSAVTVVLNSTRCERRGDANGRPTASAGEI